MFYFIGSVLLHLPTEASCRSGHSGNICCRFLQPIGSPKILHHRTHAAEQPFPWSPVHPEIAKSRRICFFETTCFILLITLIAFLQGFHLYFRPSTSDKLFIKERQKPNFPCFADRLVSELTDRHQIWESLVRTTGWRVTE